MIRTTNLTMIAALLLALVFSAIPAAQPAEAAGTVSLTVLSSAYTQDFNTLALSGTSSTVPTGWEFAETGTNNNSTYTAGTGSGNAGDTYSFGAASASERSFGGLLSGSLVPTVGAQFTNNTGGTITSLAIAYTGEMWRAGVTNRNAADRMDFQLSTNATSLATGTWVDYDSLDFSSPNIITTLGAQDGNSAGNRTALSFTITGLGITNGASFWIRWTDFNISGSDDGLSVDDFSLIPYDADTAPSVASTTPANGAIAVAPAANITIDFNEAVNVSGSWFDITCTTSGAHTAAVSNGPTSFVLDPDTDFGNPDSCTLTVYGANVTDQDINDPPDEMVGDYMATFSVADVCTQPFTPIYSIQGSGLLPAITGTVTTKGVVVGDYEGASPTLRGFYLQDMNGDANPATSDGIFVFNGSNNSVALGSVVYVTGTAADFQDQTQISSVTNIAACGTGSVLPVSVSLPVASTTFLEQYEGMLVTLPQTLYVTEHFQLGRFGQVVVSSVARLQQPTNVVLPGVPALALQAANNLNRIIIDDANNGQNADPILFGRNGLPLSASNTLRGGDTTTGVVGVMTYTWAGNSASGNAYRVRPINAMSGFVNFVEANTRPAAAPVVGGNVKVVGMNLLNYFNTFADRNAATPGCFPSGTDSDCRGANSATEFTRQSAKTVAAILAMNPDVIGVNEIENDGYGPTSALQSLVDQLNFATAPGTYAFIDVDANTSQLNALGTDAIKVGMLYKPGVVTPVGQTSVLNTVTFVNGGDASPRSRPSLAQAFQLNTTGSTFIVDVNHLKSKGSPCTTPDAGDGQGNCNQVRVNAATELMTWLATNPTGTGDSDILLIGDYNSYAMEDPITVIKSAGFTNLIETMLGADAYSYVFDGQWGYLDHALGSASIVSQVSGVGDYHINSDEPSILDYNVEFKSVGQVTSLFAPDQFRVSDHDPVLIGLDLLNLPPTVDAGGPYLVAVGGTIPVTATGSDPEGKPLIYEWDLDNNGSFETPGNTVNYTAGLTPGIYDIYARATDPGGEDATDDAIVVVFDPNGGFVTGGGWIMSPAGAYTADPSLAGKATFGFVSKYVKGSTFPVGNTNFQFQAAGFHFQSTSYDWLVVAGKSAKYKGVGTINGAGEFKFQLSAVDGSPDTFRLKIWTEDQFGIETLIYDNGSQQAIGGGSIVVHK